MKLPPRIKYKSHRENAGKRSPAHRRWVAGHACCACGSSTAIECAHVRNGTDGGTGIKPSDRWCISLCKDCHTRQHMLGEASFELENDIDMKALARVFFAKSPHRSKLESDQ